ncbi:pimeloyl-ACP methyl ester carboxylesterase [Sphingomonas jejuensis]|uniref:Pimeloyl-ACP methyl ester carboxylesterase n=1 Tax=Sphingomonas jejuensis TaxID=904715 RepID=A0ABX0XK22_9SPHN|nr:alpha/beta hydrolase [Sphingomonas jejuensis]NJC33081.1 pimeloyl-ACP methyl ester carboxylesterase [Sphingomonas jejuensis]
MGDGLDWHDGYVWSADGVRLHHRDQPGPKDRPALLCIPGLTRNVRDFASLAARMKGRHRVISVDLRGRGESGYARDPLSYTPLTYVSDLARVLAELRPGSVVPVGTSLGGLVTMLMAGAGVVEMAGAILNDVGPELDPTGLERIRGYVGRGGSYPTWLHAARALADNQREVHPTFALGDWIDAAKRVMRLEPSGRVAFDYDMRIAEPFRLPGGEAGVDLWPALDRLAPIPVLILRGERSDLLSAEVQARMAARLPYATAVTVPGVGHAPTLDEPVAVAAIDRFLDQIGPEPR